MNCTVEIDENLYSVYPEIRLGLLKFHADVRESSAAFWSYMNHEILPLCTEKH